MISKGLNENNKTDTHTHTHNSWTVGKMVKKKQHKITHINIDTKSDPWNGRNLHSDRIIDIFDS